MIAYIIYVFIMFTWINSLKNRLYKIYKEDKKEDKVFLPLIDCALAAFLDIIEFAIVIWFLYTLRRIG